MSYYVVLQIIKPNPRHRLIGFTIQGLLQMLWESAQWSLILRQTTAWLITTEVDVILLLSLLRHSWRENTNAQRLVHSTGFLVILRSLVSASQTCCSPTHLFWYQCVAYKQYNLVHALLVVAQHSTTLNSSHKNCLNWYRIGLWEKS